eukprot:TRINITY_DN11943_c0_g1_i1.p2 TRINITY_DN11943_c0_g1~~TRINITY_DN11943_c0_g1_i1.p2  ORF type:complete len:469 (+),score=148.24 TRINITY_DN11943_c0_g1_i1:85-1407(+)
MAQLPGIGSKRSSPRGGAKAQRRSRSALGVHAQPHPQQPPRSETSLGGPVPGPTDHAAPELTGIPWLDDMRRELGAEALEAHRVGTEPGMHSGFSNKFEIPQHRKKEPRGGDAQDGQLVPAGAGDSKRRQGATSAGSPRRQQNAPPRAGHPVHVPYAPEVGSDGPRPPHSHRMTRRAQMGLRDFQLLAEACQRAGRAKLEANAYYKMGELCSAEREGLPRAVKHFERYLNLSKRLKDVQGEAKALNCLGIVHQDMGTTEDLEKALRYHEAHCRIADTPGRFVAYTNMGLVYAQLRNWTRSLEAHRAAMHNALRSGDKQAEALALANLGLVGRAQRDFPTAQVCMERHLELAQALHDGDAERDACEQLGHLLSDKGDYESADRFFASARDLATTGPASPTSPPAALQARSAKLKCKLGFVRASAAMEKHFREVAERMGTQQ